jgi:predicted transglutaminase-like cysteine proteinase
VIVVFFSFCLTPNEQFVSDIMTRTIMSDFVLDNMLNWIRVYERAVEFFGEDNMDEKMLIAFAKFEEGQKEVI